MLRILQRVELRRIVLESVHVRHRDKEKMNGLPRGKLPLMCFHFRFDSAQMDNTPLHRERDVGSRAGPYFHGNRECRSQGLLWDMSP